jgi:hypothetical protein
MSHLQMCNHNEGFGYMRHNLSHDTFVTEHINNTKFQTWNQNKWSTILVSCSPIEFVSQIAKKKKQKPNKLHTHWRQVLCTYNQLNIYIH